MNDEKFNLDNTVRKKVNKILLVTPKIKTVFWLFAVWEDAVPKL